MKTCLATCLLILALGVMSFGQDASTRDPRAPQNPIGASSGVPRSSQVAPPTRIASGSVIPVELTKSLDAKKAKVGDPVEAKVTQDMKTSNGQILVPKDTRVFGRVTEAQPRSKDQKESQVGVAFDHAVIKDGGEIPMPASIQAIIAPAGSGDSSSAPAQGAATSVPEPSGGGMASGGPGGRAVGGAVPSQLPTPSANAEHPVDSSTGGNGRNPITGNTQGVVGFSNLKLTTGSGSPQGSVVSSEKSNVKLESGTWILLRVN